MIAILLTLMFGAGAGGLIFGLIFMRSSKEFPRKWQHWRAEINWQILGFISMIEDHVMRTKNVCDVVNKPGKLAIITGGNRGIGLSVVERLLKCEVSVVMGVRNPKDAKQSIEGLLDTTKITGKIYYEQLDIGNMESVRNFAKIIKSKFPRIDILINNAGIMAAPYEVTVDGYESHMAVNYLGHFLLCHLLLPELKAAGTAEYRARIVNVSSCVYKLGKISFDDIHGKKYYYPPEAYNQSKLAQVLFTKHLQVVLNRSECTYVQVHAVHPGVVDTDLFVHSSSTYIPWFKKLFFKNIEEGSRTILHAALSPKIEGKGGSYLSNCTLVRTRAMTKDAALCERFFQFTCDMLKIKDFENISK